MNECKCNSLLKVILNNLENLLTVLVPNLSHLRGQKMNIFLPLILYIQSLSQFAINRYVVKLEKQLRQQSIKKCNKKRKKLKKCNTKKCNIKKCNMKKCNTKKSKLKKTKKLLNTVVKWVYFYFFHYYFFNVYSNKTFIHVNSYVAIFITH